jgi:hypothetical protein
MCRVSFFLSEDRMCFSRPRALYAVFAGLNTSPTPKAQKNCGYKVRKLLYSGLKLAEVLSSKLKGFGIDKLAVKKTFMYAH